jgi:hypothetical protein
LPCVHRGCVSGQTCKKCKFLDSSYCRRG